MFKKKLLPVQRVQAMQHKNLRQKINKIPLVHTLKAQSKNEQLSPEKLRLTPADRNDF